MTVICIQYKSIKPPNITVRATKNRRIDEAAYVAWRVTINRQALHIETQKTGLQPHASPGGISCAARQFLGKTHKCEKNPRIAEFMHFNHFI